MKNKENMALTKKPKVADNITVSAVDNKGTQIGKTAFSQQAGIGMPLSNLGGSSKKGYKFIPYSNDGFATRRSNVYPQQIARLVYDSPTNGAAIQRKAFLIKGLGIDLSLLDEKLVNSLENINHYGETINDLLDKISWDYATFSSFALKVVWGNDGKIKQLYHIPFTWVRVGECDEFGYASYYVVNNNWDISLSVTKEYCVVMPAFNPDVFKNGVPVTDLGIPDPNAIQVDNAEQLIYHYKYMPIATNGQLYYPVPDYAGALDAIETEVLIGVSNKSKITNGFGGKTIVSFPLLPQTKEEKAEIDINLKGNFTGAHNDGNVIVTYSPDKDALPQITQLEALNADTYINLEKTNKQAIITGHQIPAILLEYSAGGGFNNRGEEMRIAFEQFQATKIRSYQDNIIRVLKRVIGYMGFEKVDLQIIPFVLPKEDGTSNENVKTQGESSLK